MKESYLYIRVSTDEQAEKGYSLRAQEETLRRYCEINNIFIKGIFIEDHSAKTFHRPEFTKMLITLKKHRRIVDSILFTKWDRFSRNAADAYAMINTLNKLGAEPQAVEQPLDLEVPENKMMLAFYLAAPEVENHRKALNVVHGMRRAAKEGRWTNLAPVGYKNVTIDKKKTIVPIPEKAALIAQAFEAVAENKFSIESIRKDFYSRGLVMHRSQFYSMLRNPVYCGKIIIKAYKDEPEMLVDGVHAPIISTDLFYRTLSALDGRKKIKKPTLRVQEAFPLRGYLICPRCKRLLTASASTGRAGVKYSYYHCTSSCGVRFKADEVNSSFVSELATWKPNKAIQALYRAVVAEVFTATHKSRKEELKDVQGQLLLLKERSTKARNLLLADAIDSTDYKAIKQECDREIVQLEKRLSDLSNNPDINPMLEKAIELLCHIDTLYEEAPTVKKREIVGSIFPQKLEYSGFGFRTTSVNEAVKLIFNIGAAFSQIKNGQAGIVSELVRSGYPDNTMFEPFLLDLRKILNLAA